MESSNQIVYQNIGRFNPFGDEKPKDTKIFDTDIKKIEILKNEEEINKVVEIIRRDKNITDDLNHNEITKTIFNKSGVIIFSATFEKNKNLKAIVFNFQDINLVAKTESINRGAKNNFLLKTSDGKSVFSADFEKTESYKINKFTNLKAYSNETFDEFSKKVYEIESKNTKRKEETDCCRHASSYSGCIKCTASDTFGIFVLAFTDGEGAVAIAASCIGAGPNTFC